MFLPDKTLNLEMPKKTELLSRKLTRLLHWDLPSSQLPFRKTDASVLVAALAHFFHVSDEMLENATSSDAGKGKRRMIMFEERVKGTKLKERRIAALGGHGFEVPYPPGQSKIERENASVFAPLIHETHAGSEIRRQPSSMINVFVILSWKKVYRLISLKCTKVLAFTQRCQEVQF